MGLAVLLVDTQGRDVKVIALDLFGTVFDLSGTPREEISAYLDQCVDPVWKPLELPASWNELKPFDDARAGIGRLLSEYQVITCSNAPWFLTFQLRNKWSLPFSAITDLSQIKRYKPHPECYLHACRTIGCKPQDVLMVTANPTFGPYPFGDLEIAGAIGMKTQLIRNPGCPQTIIELAEQLGC